MDGFEKTLKASHSLVNLIRNLRQLFNSAGAKRERHKSLLQKNLSHHEASFNEVAESYVGIMVRLRKSVNEASNGAEIVAAFRDAEVERAEVPLIRSKLQGEMEGLQEYLHNHGDHKVRDVTDQLGTYIGQCHSFLVIDHRRA